VSRSPGKGTLVHSVYVHAPFCARRCVYCDFAVTVDANPDPAPWLRALRLERTTLRESGIKLGPLRTLYVGGGTPSLLGSDGMKGLRRLFDDVLTPGELEWTAEANPESFDRELAAGWHDAGVNRISLGAQTFDGGTLRWMGRLHGPDTPGQAARAAREAGISNVSVDLMFALPEGLRRSWTDDLDRAVDLDVPHLSLYGLSVEPGTRLGRSVAEGTERPADESRYREEYLEAVERFVKAGFEHYEVSSFARPGYRSRHNSAYWNGTAYVGLGNGAHSYVPPVRRWNLRDWGAYRSALERRESPLQDQEHVEGEAARLERLWLQLRTCEGIDRPDLGSPAESTVAGWLASGLAEPGGRGIRLTADGWLLLDQLSVDLDRALDLG
jgi:oxygen-independent coproporphyrinogen-3 oxidase